MMRALPHMRTLQAFEMAARRLSFTRAAERLGIAQPAVARYVSELEKYLQTVLFERQNNKLQLTPEGRQLADAISGGLGQIQAAISSIERRNEKRLVIASSFAFAHLWLMPRLGRLRKVLGDLQPQVLIADDYRDHQRAGIDFSLQYCLAESAGDHAVLLFHEIVYPVAAPEFVQRHGVMETGWSEDWLIELRDLGKGSLNWDDWFERAAVTRPVGGTRRFYDNYLYVLDAVLAGEGIGLGFNQLTDQQVAEGKLVRLGPHIERPEAGYYVLHERSNLKAQTIARRLADEFGGASKK